MVQELTHRAEFVAVAITRLVMLVVGVFPVIFVFDVLVCSPVIGLPAEPPFVLRLLPCDTLAHYTSLVFHREIDLLLSGLTRVPTHLPHWICLQLPAERGVPYRSSNRVLQALHVGSKEPQSRFEVRAFFLV